MYTVYLNTCTIININVYYIFTHTHALARTHARTRALTKTHSYPDQTRVNIKSGKGYEFSVFDRLLGNRVKFISVH